MRAVLALVLVVAVACGGDDARPCEVTAPQPSLATVDCWQEFSLQATRPLDSSLPGALTIKTMIDQAQDEELYFLDTAAYPVHRAFAIDHLGWPAEVPFTSEYLYPQRRFLLGSVTYYEEAALFTYELAPYDTASAEMIASSMELIAAATYFGAELYFHPTSEEQLARAAELPAQVPVITTEEIYAGISYQPLALGESVGRVRILTAAELATAALSPRDIIVLDAVAGDIAAVAGLVTADLQTPLAAVNVLSQQRGAPNMALRDALTLFAAHDGAWVRLTVGAFDWSVATVTAAEADEWWASHAPAPVTPPAPDFSVTALVDIDEVGIADLPAVGGSAAHFAELRTVADVVVRPGFVIPVHFYRQFLAGNGFDVDIAAMLGDADFQSDANQRRIRLTELRAAMAAAPVDADLLVALEAHLTSDFPATTMRFGSSATTEAISGFNGAGLHTSISADAGGSADALRAVWASLWNLAAFEERARASIDQSQVAMAILVYPAYAAPTANGAAVSANLFDPAPGGEDAFYINAQLGEVSVVTPAAPPTVADQLTYYYLYNNQPATYYTRSPLSAGATVLGRRELFDLGRALMRIREHFSPIYDPPPGYAALPIEVEFRLVGSGDDSVVEVIAARPFPGRGR